MKKLSAVMFFCLFGGVASADLIPPDVASCSDKKVGEACASPMGAGSCKEATCSRLDYSQGSPPKGTIEYPCMRCTPGAAETSESKPAPTGVEPAKVDPPAKTKGCAVDPATGGGILSLFMLFSGAALLSRKRKRGS